MNHFIRKNFFCSAGRFTSLFAFVCFVAVGELKAQELSRTVSLFNGVDLEGWKPVNPDDWNYWSVKDGILTGGDGVNNVPRNTFLQTVNSYRDYEFRCLFRLSGDPETGPINSGIQYRSVVEDNHIIGYQADIGVNVWGDIYDEHRRALLVKGDLGTLRHLLKEDGWNSYIIRVRGNFHELYINGVKTCEYIEEDQSIPSRGVIAFQLHGGGAAKLEVRDVTITEFYYHRH